MNNSRNSDTLNITDGAPGAKGQTDKDQPWVDVWLPEKGKANGAAFVVARVHRFPVQ